MEIDGRVGGRRRHVFAQVSGSTTSLTVRVVHEVEPPGHTGRNTLLGVTRALSSVGFCAGSVHSSPAMGMTCWFPAPPTPVELPAPPEPVVPVRPVLVQLEVSAPSARPDPTARIAHEPRKKGVRMRRSIRDPPPQRNRL